MIDKCYGRAILLLLFITLLSTPAVRSTNAPVLFFADLQSGPNSGGESVSGFAGAYVTLYGNFFGATQGSSTVTLGGNNCLRVVSWGTPHMWYQKIVVQLGSSCASGNFVVTVNNVASNALLFTVRAGNIYCVATTGSDSNNGKFPNCWATVPHIRSTWVAGDIVYVRNGVIVQGDDGFGAPLDFSGWNGTSAMPFALGGYPGETATIGGPSNGRGFITYPSGDQWWTVFNLTFQGVNSSEAFHAYATTSNWRMVGNIFTCPGRDGQTGCVTSDYFTFVSFWGNEVFNVGGPNTSKFYHALYFGALNQPTGLHDFDIGWNSVHNVQGCRGIMFHSCDSGGCGNPGEAYNLTIHDNLVHDIRCDGINLPNTNASTGPVLVYNNVIYNAGQGPDPGGIQSTYTCFGASDGNGSPTAPIQFFNNTCYNPSSGGSGGWGAYDVNVPFTMTNNITDIPTGKPYFLGSGSNTKGSNNLWFGSGSAPSQTSGNLTADPLFVNPTAFDFHLRATSPAIDAAATVNLGWDIDGVQRPQGSKLDIGAYEFSTGITLPKPSPPTNLTVVVK